MIGHFTMKLAVIRRFSDPSRDVKFRDFGGIPLLATRSLGAGGGADIGVRYLRPTRFISQQAHLLDFRWMLDNPDLTRYIKVSIFSPH